MTDDLSSSSCADIARFVYDGTHAEHSRPGGLLTSPEWSARLSSAHAYAVLLWETVDRILPDIHASGGNLPLVLSAFVAIIPNILAKEVALGLPKRDGDPQMSPSTAKELLAGMMTVSATTAEVARDAGLQKLIAICSIVGATGPDDSSDT